MPSRFPISSLNSNLDSHSPTAYSRLDSRKRRAADRTDCYFWEELGVGDDARLAQIELQELAYEATDVRLGEHDERCVARFLRDCAAHGRNDVACGGRRESQEAARGGT